MPNPNVVYAFGSVTTSDVKLGTTGDVKRRLPQVQGTTRHRLEVLWLTTGGYELETALKRHFKDRRIKGEWFDFSGADPVVEISAAAQIINDRMDAEDAAWSVPKEGYDPCSVFGFGGVPVVMPKTHEGGWRCVAWNEQSGRRCTDWMDDRMLHQWPSEWMTWVVPGLGAVDGLLIDVPKGDMALSLLKMQVCRKHVGARYRSPVAWHQFHPRRDIALIKPFGTSAPLGLMPGFAGMEQEVRDYVWSQIRPLSDEEEW